MKKVRLFVTALLVVCLFSCNVFAAGFTPSVESQEAPEVSQATITGADGKVVTADVDLVVTPYSKADAASAQIGEKLVSAMDDIKKASSLADLPSADGTIKQKLQGALDTFDTDYTVDDLVVRDLFDVSLEGDAAGLLAEAGAQITLDFKVTVQRGEVLIVAHNYETGKWEVIDPSLVKINNDGTVSVTLDSLSPIAFLTVANDDSAVEPGPSDEKPSKPDAAKSDGKVKSPQTGESVNYYMILVIALCAAAGFCGVRARRYSR